MKSGHHNWLIVELKRAFDVWLIKQIGKVSFTLNHRQIRCQNCQFTHNNWSINRKRAWKRVSEKNRQSQFAFYWSVCILFSLQFSDIMRIDFSVAPFSKRSKSLIPLVIEIKFFIINIQLNFGLVLSMSLFMSSETVKIDEYIICWWHHILFNV